MCWFRSGVFCAGIRVFFICTLLSLLSFLFFSLCILSFPYIHRLFLLLSLWSLVPRSVRCRSYWRDCWRIAVWFTIRASDNSHPNGFQADPRTQQASCAMDTISCHHGIKAVGSWSWPLIPIYLPRWRIRGAMPSFRPNDVHRDNFDLFLPLFLRFVSQDIERLLPASVPSFNSHVIHTSYRPM